ncbi:hypothetical protein BDV59DRAFT_124698 [Aspergillus ambiguus]|uniref:uncharacterized protein n=1 Tax=Aspergillus ambiguus TaxID=176160 RepID=UPI003CCD1626
MASLIRIFALSSVFGCSIASALERYYLTATAIVNTPDNFSTLQCWNLTTPFVPNTLHGTEQGAIKMTIGDVTNVTYFSRPPHEDYGLHTAPYAQLVVFMSGLADISLPRSPEHAIVLGGQNGLIFAMDTVGEGHYISYSSNEPTVGLMIPLTDGKAPEHVVIEDGKGCGFPQQVVKSG